MTQTTLPTTERLALALEALNDPRLSKIIERARAGDYDDYKSEVTAFPQHLLIAHLHPFNYPTFIERVINGEFDSTPAESQAWADSQTDPEIAGIIKKMKVDSPLPKYCCLCSTIKPATKYHELAGHVCEQHFAQLVRIEAGSTQPPAASH